MTILSNALSQTSLKLVPRLFEHARRRAIPIKHMRVQPAQIEIRKRVLSHDTQRLAGNPASPKRLAPPGNNLRRAPLDVVLRREAYTTNRLTGYVDREIRQRFLIDNYVKPVTRIASRVRIRETIAQIDRNFPVVCITHNRVAIAPLPTTHSTCFQQKIHVCTRGNTAAPRGMMNPSPLPACSSASSIVRTGTIRMRRTSSAGSSESRQTRNRSAFVKSAHAVCPFTSYPLTSRAARARASRASNHFRKSGRPSPS